MSPLAAKSAVRVRSSRKIESLLRKLRRELRAIGFQNRRMKAQLSLLPFFLSMACAPVQAATGETSTDLAKTAPALRARVASIEKRSAVLRDELRSTDIRIEERIGNMVDTLRSVADSTDSRTKVARMKERTMEELKKCIDDYQRKRATLQEELRRPTLNLTEEQKRWGIAAFDAHIDKRIAQIVELYETLPQHKDYEKYKVVPGGWGWFGPTYAENQDWKQNQTVVLHTKAMRKKIVEGLSDTIRRLQKQSDDLQIKFMNSKVDSERDALTDEITRNEAILLKRREQLTEVLQPNGYEPPGIPLRQAVTLDKALDEAITGVRIETNNLYRCYSEYINELVALNASKAVLSAAEAKIAGKPRGK